MDVWSDPKLSERIQSALATDTSGDDQHPASRFGQYRYARSQFAPRLAYGRNRGPVRGDARMAAVVVALFIRDGQWFMPLTMRPTTLQHHGGQICLPGGQIESGESPVEAAIREYTEELGLSPKIQVHCGELSNHYVFKSNNLVHPIVVATEPPSAPWKPDPTEVAKVIELPLKTLLAADAAELLTRRVNVKSPATDELADAKHEFCFAAPAIKFNEFRVWGATAMILDELARILQSP